MKDDEGARQPPNFQHLSFTLTRIKDLQAVATQWLALEERADNTFFLSWDWIGTWLETVPGPSPLLLTIKASGVVVGLAIIQTTKLWRRFLPCNAITLNRTGDAYNDLINVEYNDILADRRYSRTIWPAVLSFLEDANLPASPFRKWDEFHVAMATSEVEKFAQQANLMVLELAHKRSWFVDLDGVRQSGKPYLNTLSSNARYQIRRAIRHYEQDGVVRGDNAQSLEQAMASFSEFKDLHQAYWVRRGMPGGFSNQYFELFHRTLLQNCLARGTVEIFRVSAGSKLIGQVYNFIYRGRVYAYQTGFSYEDDAKAKPGLVSHYLCIEQHLKNGMQIYDFMAGDNRYKQTFGTSGPDMSHYVLQRKTLIRLIETGLRRVKHLLKMQAL